MLTESHFKERRDQRRIRLEAPATVTAGRHSIAASTKDISARGLFFFTDVNIYEGSEIDIVLMLPEELQLPFSGMVCCNGRVVRVDSFGGQQYGIAVKIDHLAPTLQV